MEKLDLDSEKRGEYEKGRLIKEWEEPRIEYQLSEKIKEVKSTNKGNLGFDYKIKVEKDTNIVYVQKVNEQLSMKEVI